MSKIRILVLLSVLVAAAGFWSYQAGIISEPDFGVKDRGDWNNVDSSEIEIESTVWINNQNPASLNLREPKLDYSLIMNDVKLAHGTKKGLNIEEGNRTIKFHTSLIQDNLRIWWVKHMRNDEVSSLKVPVQLHLNIGPFPFALKGSTYEDKVETDIEGSLDSSVSQMKGVYEGPKLLPGDSSLARQSRPEIEIVDAEAAFGKIELNQTQILSEIKVKNRNQYPIPAPKFTGNLEMNEVRLAEWDAKSHDKSKNGNEIFIGPGETEDISFRIDIDNSKIDNWLISHIRKEEYSKAEMEIQLKLEAEGVSFTVPKDEGIKCRFNLQTAILEDDQKPSSKFEGCGNPF